METHTDANYGGSVGDRRSTLGYCAFLCGNLVAWRSKKGLPTLQFSQLTHKLFMIDIHSLSRGGVLSIIIVIGRN